MHSHTLNEFRLWEEELGHLPGRIKDCQKNIDASVGRLAQFQLELDALQLVEIAPVKNAIRESTFTRTNS